ncbi:MAG: ABC transporter ATP-binding protein, partial [Alphaproteobacteria bacterium]
LLGLILLMGLVNMAGVASIMPFLAVLANPEVVQQQSLLAAVYDGLGFTDTHDFLILLGVATFVFIVFAQAVKAVTTYAQTRFATMRTFTLASRLLEGYLHQPYVWFLHRHSADLGKTVLSEVDQVINKALVPAIQLLAQSVVVGFLVLLLVLIDPVVAVVAALVVGGAYGLVFGVVRGYLSELGRERVRANKARYEAAQEAMGGIKDVKLLGLEDGYLRRFRGPAQSLAICQANSQIINSLPRFLLEAIAFGGMLVLVLVLLVRGDGTLGSVLPVIGVYALAGTRLLGALQGLYQAVAALRFAGPALDALHDDLTATRRTERAHRSTGAPLAPTRDVALEDVTYTYPGAERPALAGLDLAIAANTTVGIVGATGAGKTTAVDVLLGLLEPDAGRLVVDGEPIGPHNRRAWQRAVGYVPQHIFLTDDTVAANIALGIPPEQVDMAAVERAARVAELHRFVMGELPRGYATKVGERGVRLSGGQRQRIGIARALYHDPAVLVLDEATSALDNRTERAVMDAVHNLAHAKTIVMIAHRLSTVRACDRIVMLEHGRCVAAGTYDELVAHNRSFRELAQAAS